MDLRQLRGVRVSRNPGRSENTLAGGWSLRSFERKTYRVHLSQGYAGIASAGLQAQGPTCKHHRSGVRYAD